MIIEHEKELTQLKESLAAEHVTELDKIRRERKKELEEQKSLQSAVEEEVRLSLETKKKESQETLNREMVR